MLKPAVLKPAWIGRFHVTGPRDNRFLNGFPAAFLWVAAQADDAAHLEQRVAATLEQNGLTVVRVERVEQVADDAALPFEIRKLLREARRHPDLVVCGKFEGMEDHAGRRPVLLELRTERMLLRPWLPIDREPFARMNADRDLTSYLYSKPISRHQSDEAVDRYLAGFHQYGFGFLVAELKPRGALTGEFAGMMGIRLMHDVLPKVQQPAIEIAWRIKTEHQRKGLATEGGRALLKLAFIDFQLPEVVAVTAVANAPARGLMEKLGMKHRTDLEFNHPEFPPRHLFARHTVYTIRNPND